VPAGGKGLPWVRTAEIGFEPILKTQEAVSEVALRECSLPIAQPGTVLIAMFGEGKTRGLSAVLGIEATFNQACFAIYPNDTFDPDYLQLWLMGEYRELRHLADGRGGSQANLNGSILEDLKVPWVERDVQAEVVDTLRGRLSLVTEARNAARQKAAELQRLADSIISDSLRCAGRRKERLFSAIDEVSAGIGSEWKKYPVLGATRAGLAPARERPGKHAERYKPVTSGTVFYNPMRILIGSIAFADDDDEPGITSPDYVVLKGKPGVVDSRWFYYWLRSPLGQRCIQSLARGAVRERMLFNRLAEGEVELPDYDTQVRASKALAQIKPMRAAMQKQIAELELLPQKLLAEIFGL
jgi:type I restriction enzyme, S subunit